MDKTLEALIVDVQQAIYQSAGIGTQVYTEDVIVSMITDAFIMLATDPDKNWKRFKTYETFTLDGVTGRTTVPVSSVFPGGYDAIDKIYIGESERALTAVDDFNNPLAYKGDQPLGYVHDTVDVIKFIPATASGNVTIVGLNIPTSFELDDTVPFDYLTLKWFVAWQYMSDDGSNPAAAEKLRMLYEARYDHISKQQDKGGVALNGVGQPDYPREWWGYR